MALSSGIIETKMLLRIGRPQIAKHFHHVPPVHIAKEQIDFRLANRQFEMNHPLLDHHLLESKTGISKGEPTIMRYKWSYPASDSRMKITSAEFIISSPDYETCPESDLGEIAFIGRSNVGKSSLINYLTNSEGLAKTSSKPGHTTMINFFLINNAWSIVDLPGYGYARRSKEDRERFHGFVSDYLLGRRNLICVFILIDSRIPPQELDLDYVEWIVSCRIPFALVFTKTDKIKPTPRKQNIEKFAAALAERCSGTPKIFASSTKNKTDRFDLLDFIEAALSTRS